MPKERLRHGRSVRIDAAKLMSVMNGRGVSVEQLADRSDKSVATINNLLAGKPVYRTTALPVAKALEISLDLLLEGTRSSTAVSAVHEYLVADVLTDWQTASNGLRFQICRLRHLELDRQARGKRFDLRDLATDEAQRCRTLIKRHPNVCEAMRDHPNIIRNVTAFHDPEESFYWVVDEWIEGESLQRQLQTRTFNEVLARHLLLDVANGLQALHQQGIVRRELNPAAILIRKSDGRAILTEFELAKLIDRGPTVSTDEWPVDPYRAGEADGDDVDIRSDVYSWGRIAVHAIVGELPAPGGEEEALSGTGSSRKIQSLLVSATAMFRSDRPATMTQVIAAMESWERDGS